MSFDASTLAEWTKMRDKLLARRTELLAELADIQAALAPLEATKPPAVRRKQRRTGSLAASVESYVREHPNMTAMSIAAALGVERAPASNTLIVLANRGLLVRYRGAGNNWHYSLAPDVAPPPPPFQDTAVPPSGSSVDAPSEGLGGTGSSSDPETS